MHQYFLLAVATLASANPSPQMGKGGKGFGLGGAMGGAKSGGTGSFGPASYAVSEQLPGYTIYNPSKAPPEKIPVIWWANGACSDDGSGFSNFLLEVSSHGYVIVANGKPGSGMGSKAGQDKMKKALDLVETHAGTGALAHADKSRIAAAGQSCGGMNAARMVSDPRIKCAGIFDGGGAGGGGHAPIGLFVGGTSDMAYQNSLNDWGKFTGKTKAILVNNPKGGHMQDFFSPNGGLIAIAGRSWFDWILKNSTEAKATLTPSGKLAAAGWTVKMKGF